MQDIPSRTLNFKASVLASVTDKKLANTDTSFFACEALGISWQNKLFCYSYNRWSGSGPYLLNMLPGRDLNRNCLELGSWLC